MNGPFYILFPRERRFRSVMSLSSADAVDAIMMARRNHRMAILGSRWLSDWSGQAKRNILHARFQTTTTTHCRCRHAVVMVSHLRRRINEHIAS